MRKEWLFKHLISKSNIVGTRVQIAVILILRNSDKILIFLITEMLA